MPNLIQSLQSFDLGHLRIVAGFWGLDLVSPDSQAALQELAGGMLNPALLAEIVETLPAEARLALQALEAEKGRLPWGDFSRRFGELREVGAGKRDREQLHLQPVSSSEVLFYRGLVGRAFFETPAGPLEFAYIPDDLLPLLPSGESQIRPLPGRLASPVERAHPIPVTDRILDDACTWLAARRMRWDGLPQNVDLTLPEAVLGQFLQVAGLLVPGQVPATKKNGPGSAPHLEAVKDFLEMPRPEALALLTTRWLNSTDFNELHQVPGLVCEGTWSNDPLATRRFILDLIGRIPPGKWWSLAAFVRMIHETHPDFERPAGDFDSWLIRRETDDAFLHGFTHWEAVDGGLIRYLVTGPLHWLGLLDLASAESGGAATAFRRTAWSMALLQGHAPRGLSLEDGKLHVAGNGRISVPVRMPRSVRYQLARFSEWEAGKPDEYRYRLTPNSLQNARKQGLKVSQLTSLLNKYTAAPLPPSFVRALTRWELNGTEARLEQPVVLRLSRPEVLEELRQSRAGRFLGETLGPTTVVVKPGAQARIMAALGEHGLLADDGLKGIIIADGETIHK
jgi:hypothetical protein